MENPLHPLGSIAFDPLLDARTLAESAFVLADRGDEDHAEAVFGFAADLATIQNLTEARS